MFFFEIRIGKKNNWAMVGREIGLISRGYFAKEYGNSYLRFFYICFKNLVKKYKKEEEF